MARPQSESAHHSYSVFLHESKMKKMCEIAGTTTHRDALNKAVEYYIEKGGK